MTQLTLGQRIASQRKLMNLSQEALSEQLDVSRQAISKWESDGAVPEVDKLIALSRLFGVSVGWLLGVEESPGPSEQKEEISEELLRKIEEIVLRYRPRKQPLSTGKKVLLGIAGALALWAIVTFAGHWSILSSTVGYVSAQVRNNNEQNAQIMEQLDALEARMDSEPVQPERFGLSEFSFDIEPHEQTPTAVITFTAVPSSWHGDYSASLVARWDNKDYLSQACAWDGSGLLAIMPLKIQDGYEFWLRVEYPDGTQEQMKLADEYAETLKTGFDIEITVTPGIMQFDMEAGTVELLHYETTVTRPYLLEICSNFVAWKSVDYQLYHRTPDGSRELIATHQLFDPVAHEGDEYKNGNERAQLHSITYPTPQHEAFDLPDIQVGDSIDLWIRAEMSNGIITTEHLDSWTYDGDGIFRQVWATSAGTAPPGDYSP